MVPGRKLNKLLFWKGYHILDYFYWVSKQIGIIEVLPPWVILKFGMAHKLLKTKYQYILYTCNIVHNKIQLVGALFE